MFDYHNCETCSYKTKLLSSLIQHERSHEMETNELFQCEIELEPYKCYNCNNFQTSVLTDLKKHIENGHSGQNQGERLYKCEKCKMKTFSKYLFIRHTKFDTCTWKNEKVEKEEETEEEEVTVVKRKRGRPRSTKKLKLPKVKQKRVRKNLSIGKKVKTMLCDKCGAMFKYITELKHHVIRMHLPPSEIKWSYCTKCPKKFKLKYGLKQHMKFHEDGIVRFSCTRCEFTSQYKTCFKKHVQRHELEEETEKYETFSETLHCAHCSYATEDRNELKRHLRQHTESQKTVEPCEYECVYCLFRNRDKMCVATHLKDSHASHWFDCDVCPNKVKYPVKICRFDTGDSSYKWFICKECPFKSVRLHDVHQHEESEHEQATDAVRWFYCSHCSYKTVSDEELKKHYSEYHTKKRPIYQCNECSYKACFKRMIMTHKKLAHTERVVPPMFYYDMFYNTQFVVLK